MECTPPACRFARYVRRIYRPLEGPYSSSDYRLLAVAVAPVPSTHYYTCAERASPAWLTPVWFCLVNSTLSGLFLHCKPFLFYCRVASRERDYLCHFFGG